jgi:hypothetical protein
MIETTIQAAQVIDLTELRGAVQTLRDIAEPDQLDLFALQRAQRAIDTLRRYKTTPNIGPIIANVLTGNRGPHNPTAADALQSLAEHLHLP